MSKERELLRRALEALEWCDEECCDEPLEEAIRAFLAAEPEAEPVAWGQPDACGNIVETITPDDKTHTKAPKGWADIYSVPLYTRPEKIDPILRTAGSMKYHPSYVAGWNNCIDAMSNGAEAKKPMAEEEIPYHGSHYYRAFLAGVRFAEKHHGIGGDDNG